MEITFAFMKIFFASILMLTCCCNQFDPSFGHNAEGSDGGILKEAGKQLRSLQTDQVERACKTISEIFFSNSPFCPVSVGPRRTCMLFLNWLQGLGGSCCSAQWTQVGQLLITQIARTEPSLARSFFTESLEVIRILQDIVVPATVEVFPRLVAATRSVILGSSQPEDRGIVITVSSSSETALDVLWGTLEQLVNKFPPPLFITETNAGKLGMCLLAAKGDQREALRLAVPDHLVDANIEIFSQLDITEDEEATQNVFHPPLTDDVIITQPNVSRILDGLKTARCMPSYSVSGPPPVTVEGLLKLLTRDDDEDGNVSLLQSIESLLIKQDDCVSMNLKAKMLVFSIKNKAKNKIFSFFGSHSKDRTLVGHVVGQLCFAGDLDGLGSLAGIIGSPNPAELLVGYLHHPMLIHCCSVQNPTIANFVASKILQNKFPLNQLIEANGSEVIATAIHYVASTHRSTPAVDVGWFQEASRVIKQVIAVVAGASTPHQSSTKRLKPMSSNPNADNPSTIFLLENYLHLIQLVEDGGWVALGLLIESVGEGIANSFLTRTVEAICKFNDPTPLVLWKIFGSKTQDDRVIPVLMEAGQRSRTTVSPSIDTIWSGDRMSAILKALEVELVKERTVYNKIAILRAATRRLAIVPLDLSGTDHSGEVMRSVCDLVRLNIDNPTVLSVVSEFLGLVGPLLVGGFTPTGSLDRVEGWEGFLVKLVGQYLIPELRLSSHGFAVQEILKCVGKSVFPQEIVAVITPYTTSSYRADGGAGEIDTGNIESLEGLFGWCTTKVLKEPTRSVLKSLRPAVSRDSGGLLSWVLPYAIEFVGSDVSNDDELVAAIHSVTKGFLNILNGTRDSAVGKKIDIKAIFSVIDHVKTILVQNGRKPGRADQFYSGISSVVDSVYVEASLSVEDYARALQYQEQVMTERGDDDDDDIYLLGTIYEHLGMTAGVVGATTLGAKSRRINDMKLAVTGRFSEIILREEKTFCVDGIGALVDSGHYRSAIAVAQSCGTVPFSEKVAEAIWKLSSWPDEGISDGKVEGFHSQFAHTLSTLSKATREPPTTSSTNPTDLADSPPVLCWELVKKLGINSNNFEEIIAQIFLLNCENRSVTDLQTIIRGISPKASKCRQLLLEGSIAIAHRKHQPSEAASFQVDLMKELRKVGNASKVKQMLPVVVNGGPEWAKAAWFVGERSGALSFLGLRGDDWRSQLLYLRYSAELERMVPKLVIQGYRDLQKKAATDREKGDVCFAFGEYLDTVGSWSEGSVWNRTLLVQELTTNLLKALTLHTNSKRILFCISRIFQLHWDLFHSGESSQVKLAAEIVSILQTVWREIPCWVWYVALPHLLVRAGSGQLGAVCEDIIVAVLSEYPRQASWMVLPGLLNSKATDRRSIAARIIQRVTEHSDYPNIQQLVTVVRSVAESLVGLARLDTSSIKTLNETKEGSKLLRNTGGLLVVPTKNQIAPSSVLLAKERTRPPFSDELRISKFIDSVYVYNTKAKPKRISVVDSDGRTVMFILKVEKKTDLRKDARMMDFINVVNSELASRRCSDSMRTYQVLTLSEDTGLIEFVPNLTTVRKIIDDNLSKVGKSVSVYLNKDVMNKLSHKTEGFPFFKSIVDTIPPILAEFFSRQFPTPRLWQNARNTFTVSQAFWSLSGWVVGLGDRHPDNLLIALDTGEVVHVDFDCIFSRGMILTIPELVPFRLTQICVTAMGVTGVEGLFRASCEQIMSLVRERKKMLLSVLHAFIADPLIDWQGGATSFKKARDVISAIERKLNGFVDVGEIRPDSCEERLIAFTEGSEKNSGLGKDRGAALSVEGQVDELIRAAVCQRNLAKMYLGWMPMF